MTETEGNVARLALGYFPCQRNFSYWRDTQSHVVPNLLLATDAETCAEVWGVMREAVELRPISSAVARALMEALSGGHDNNIR